jgi:cytochrome c556
MRIRNWLAVGIVFCAGAAWAATPQETIDARIAGMKSMAGNVQGAGKAATPAEAKTKLAAAIKFAETIPSAFPKGTGIGDKGVTKTRALQDIWAKAADFKAASDALVAALKAAEAAAGDQAKFDAALGDIRKSCGGCHTPFRGPETE